MISRCYYVFVSHLCVLLAPMEGVLDPLVRCLLSEVNDYDLCITEFVRVVDTLLPAKLFTVYALN